MTTSVRYYDSTMPGAPSLSATAGTLISVLDACLVNGFGSVTINPLVVASNVATATVSTGHGFAMVGSTGPVVRISGATPAGLNGDWRITVISATQFTFTTTGITDQTATGTISAKRAPAGFSKAFSGTNKAVYRSLNTEAVEAYYRIQDDLTGFKAAEFRMYESMTGVDTGVNGTLAAYINKFLSSNIWYLAANDRFVHLITHAGDAIRDYMGGYYFGQFIKSEPTDSFHVVCAMADTNRANSNPWNDSCTAYTNSISAYNGKYFLRGLTFLNYVNAMEFSVSTKNSITALGASGFAYSGIGALQAANVFLCEASSFRGRIPGLLNPLHIDNPPAGAYNLDDGNTYVSIPVGNRAADSGRVLWQISGEWK